MTKHLTAEQVILDRISRLEDMIKHTKNPDRKALVEYAKITLEDILLELKPLDF